MKLEKNEIAWYLTEKSLSLTFANKKYRGDFANKIGCDFAIAPDRLKGLVEYSKRINNERSLYFKLDPKDHSIIFCDDIMREKFFTLVNLQDKASYSANNKLVLKDELLKNANQANPVILSYDKNRLENKSAKGLLEDIFPRKTSKPDSVVEPTSNFKPPR